MSTFFNKCSLHLCMSSYPHLDQKYRSLDDPLDLMALRSILIKQTATDGLFLGEQMLKALYEWLTTLIGSSLSRRLLLDVWENTMSAPPSQENSP